MSYQGASFDFAVRRTEEFSNTITARDKVVKDHHEAMDCRNCEEYLCAGIESYHWIMRADESIHSALYDGEIEADSEAFTKLQELLLMWLDACRATKVWAEENVTKGYDVDNLDEFRVCLKEVEAIVKSFTEEPILTDPMRELRDQAIQEHKDGKTVEFISEEE